jgi:hypothetical protein
MVEDSGAKLSITKFYGSVNTVDWTYGADGENYMVITGICSVLEADAVAGFKVKGTDANWFVRIEGDTQSYNIPGCKVRAIMSHPKGVELARSSSSRVLVVP